MSAGETSRTEPPTTVAGQHLGSVVELEERMRVAFLAVVRRRHGRAVAIKPRGEAPRRPREVEAAHPVLGLRAGKEVGDGPGAEDPHSSVDGFAAASALAHDDGVDGAEDDLELLGDAQVLPALLDAVPPVPAAVLLERSQQLAAPGAERGDRLLPQVGVEVFLQLAGEAAQTFIHRAQLRCRRDVVPSEVLRFDPRP